MESWDNPAEELPRTETNNNNLRSRIRTWYQTTDVLAGGNLCLLNFVLA